MFAIKTIQNTRDYQEDRYFISKNEYCTLAFVADGHGGAEISEFIKQNLSKLLLETCTHAFSSNLFTANIIRTLIINLNKKILQKFNKAGSTFSGVLITNNTVFIINIGDSRTCCSLKPMTKINFLVPMFGSNGHFIPNLHVEELNTSFFCTLDHTPDSLIEQARIKASGGFIENGRLNAILSVSRSFGDADIQPGISAVPDIFWFSKSAVTGPLLLYSDGVYEPIKSMGDPNFDPVMIYELAKNKGPEALIQYSVKKGSGDNITVLMINV